MRRILSPLTLLFTVMGALNGNKSHAQLINDGATIKIQPGAAIFCAGNFENKNAGAVSNDGKLEVQGNFTNTAVYNSATADDSLTLSGGGNVTLNGGVSSITNLWINKTASSNFVTLTGTTIMTGKLDYDQGTFTTDPIVNPSFIFSSPTTATYDFAAGKEIIGNVRRTGWANSSEIVFNQANMRVATSGGSAPANFTVTMIPQSAGGDPTDAEREVKRKFLFTYTGGTGFTTDIKYAYLDGELNTNTEGNLAPWARISGEWNSRLTTVAARDNALNFVTTTGINTTDLAQEWKLADPKYAMTATALLRGPYNPGTGLMNTSLNSAGIIPQNQPYNVTPFNYTGPEFAASVPNANVVDWILVEMRKPVSGAGADALSSTIIGRRAGFLLNNGAIVDLDGSSPLSFDITKQGNSFMVIRHRNHLGVMSDLLSSNAAGTFANDFRVLNNWYKAPGAASNPEIQLSPSSNYGLWAGDANKTGNLASSDLTAVKAATAASATGYIFPDVNMTANLAASDLTLVKLMISNSATNSTPGRPVVIKSNIPDVNGPEQ